jgi:hypothetical protein
VIIGTCTIPRNSANCDRLTALTRTESSALSAFSNLQFLCFARLIRQQAESVYFRIYS